MKETWKKAGVTMMTAIVLSGVCPAMVVVSITQTTAIINKCHGYSMNEWRQYEQDTDSRLLALEEATASLTNRTGRVEHAMLGYQKNGLAK